MDSFDNLHAMAHNSQPPTALHGHGSGSMFSAMPADMRGVMFNTQIDDDTKSANSQPIPLICFICPKNSKFSDVSHLLTHVSSKGHLAKKFSLEVNTQDPAARQALDQFAAWYEKYNIRQLLQNRNQNRHQRSTKGRRSGDGQASTMESMTSATSTMANQHGQRRKRASTLQPGKKRTRNEAQTTAHSAEPSRNGEDPDSIPDLPPPYKRFHGHQWEDEHDAQQWSDIQVWNAATVYYEPGEQQGVDMNDPDEDDQPELKFENFENYEEENDEDNDDRNGNDPVLASESTVETGVSTTDSQTGVEMSEEERARQDVIHFSKYLKGDIAALPGVNGFDAAPPEQRRMRNQKKDPSVMRQMEADSQSVTTLEHVTDTGFNHVRTRDVYDEPSIDGSADEGEENESDSMQNARQRSPKARRGGTRSRGNAKCRGRVSPDSNMANPSTTRKNRNGRSVRRGAVRTMSSRVASEIVSTDRVTRSEQANLRTPTQLSLPGLIGFGNNVVDVFRDHADPIPGRIGSSTPQRRLDIIPGLSLRPGNPNLTIQSPTSRPKRLTSTHAFNGKENNQLSFGPPQTASNPYLTTNNSLDESSVNPLCVQTRDSSFRGFSSYEEAKPLTAGFQPINSQVTYNSLQMSHSNESYQSLQRRNVFDI